MDIIHTVVAWFKTQNWFVTIPVFLGYLNIVVAGARVMGWNHLADFCGKLEDAITAMVQAALNKNKGVQDDQKDPRILPQPVSGSELPKV